MYPGINRDTDGGLKTILDGKKYFIALTSPPTSSPWERRIRFQK
jgi:hypothetical protein